MGHIYVNNINFEHEFSGSLHDILVNSGTSTQTLDEQIQFVAHIYVNNINLEVPVTELTAEILTCTQTSTQTIEEVITGTPVVEEEVAVGGGAGQRIRVIGGRPWLEETLTNGTLSAQAIGEEIFISETVECYTYNDGRIDTKVRRPIYKQPRKVEIMSFMPVNERTVVIPVEQPQINSRQREEEELLLLGII